jgi:hypothetical protein
MTQLRAPVFRLRGLFTELPFKITKAIAAALTEAFTFIKSSGSKIRGGAKIRAK